MNGRPGKRGMREALERFLRDFGERAYQFAYRLSGNVEESKELVQEALYRVARAWGRYDRSRPLESWYFSILRNAFLDSRKESRRRNGVSLDAPLSDGEGSLVDILSAEGDDPMADLERREASDRVQMALDRLSPNHLQALRLCDMDGIKSKEAARCLGIPAGTVRSRVWRARQTLRSKAPKLSELEY